MPLQASSSTTLGESSVEAPSWLDKHINHACMQYMHSDDIVSKLYGLLAQPRVGTPSPYSRQMTQDSLCLGDLPDVETPGAKPGIKREVSSEQTGEKKAKARSLMMGVVPCKLDMSKCASPKGDTAMPVPAMAASPVRPPCIHAPALHTNRAGATQSAIERAQKLMQARPKATPMVPPPCRAVAVKTPGPSAVTHNNGCMTMGPAPLPVLPKAASDPLPATPVTVASASPTMVPPPAKGAPPLFTVVPTATKAQPETKPKVSSGDIAAGPCSAGSAKNSKSQKEHASPEMMASMQKQVRACSVQPGTVPCQTFDTHVQCMCAMRCAGMYIYVICTR